MKFWVKFSKIIFRFIALPSLKKIRTKSIEAVLKKSIGLLEPEMLNEMRAYIKQKLTPQGGFSDRAGKCDLYYTLFGYYLAETLNVSVVLGPIKQYVKKVIHENKLTGINLYCGAILYSKLHGINSYSENLKKHITVVLKESSNQQSEYTNFLGILALYYLEDFKGIKRIINQYKSFNLQKDSPCPVTAATTVLFEIAGKPNFMAEEKLKSFYRNKGGFTAFKDTPVEDLLSTAVALYALNFIEADMRLIKPDCMAFIETLYDNGGFRATQADFETDVEYTLYGILALGSLNN